MLVESLVYSVALLVVANIVARRAWGVPIACGIMGLGVLPGLFCIQSPPVLLQGLLVVLAGLVCIRLKAKPNAFLTASLGATVLSYLVVGTYVAFESRKDHPLAERYPFESMEDRLAYEQRVEDHPKFSPDALGSLEAETGNEGGFRSYLLREVHQQYLTKFINSPGFGVMRKIRPSELNLRIEENEPVPFPPAPPEDWSPLNIQKGTVAPREAVPDEPARPLTWKFHSTNLVEFSNPKGFGYVKDKQHVAGFQPHQFRRLPSQVDVRWRLRHLELVSLLKFDEPAVYITEHLPRMDELRDAPTRQLDAFEMASLRSLRGGEDLIVDSTPNRIRMLGSIRAGRQCLECHTAERGQLLGAFSYRFRRL